MSNIASIGIALPEYSYGIPDICQAGRSWLEGNPVELALFERFVSSSQTTKRYFTRPIEEILEFRGGKRRAEIFEQAGIELGQRSAEMALQKARLDASDINTFLFTSCSSPVIPSIDAVILQQLRLNPSVTRVPIYQHGCAGGVIGLSLAEKFTRLGHNVLLTSVELCSLGYFSNDRTAAHLVGCAIFGDGSSSVVITPEDRGLCFVDSLSVLTANSRHMMGYDLMDDGAHLRLDKELPSFLAREVPKIVPGFLKKNGLVVEQVDWWLFHPGGMKVLTCLEETFSIEPERAIWARDVLREYGNLSSSSVLFVTAEFLKSKKAAPGDSVVMLGVGPGLTIELILFRVNESI